jgi:hypothetical protein
MAFNALSDPQVQEIGQPYGWISCQVLLENFFFPNKGVRLHHLFLQAAELYKPDIHQPDQSLPSTGQGNSQ